MSERFTERVRKVLQLAIQEAQRLNHEFIGTEHILLAIVKEGAGTGATILKNRGIDLRRIRFEIEKLVQSGPDKTLTDRLPQSPRSKKVIEYSMEEARNLNSAFIGTEHLLLGLIRTEEGVACHVLTGLGLEIEQLRQDVRNLAAAENSERSDENDDAP